MTTGVPSEEDAALLRRLPSVEGGRHLIGGVLISNVLGQGGMGTVYKGLHLRLHLPVAVKVLDRDRTEFTAQFTSEARMAALIEHPNVARVYDINVEGNLLYIVQEFIGGESAFSMLQRASRNGVVLTEVRALELAADVARGLAAIHKQGFVHLDIKPENILIRESDGLAKIVDLGLAAQFSRQEPKSSPPGKAVHAVVGTPGYISPEQFLGLPLTPACDIYAFGVTMFEILTSQPAFPKQRSFSAFDPYNMEALPDLKALRPGLSNATVDLVKACTEHDPEKRVKDSALVIELIASAYRHAISSTPKTIARQRAPELLSITPAKVVCVDDDDEIGNLLRDTLNSAGHSAQIFNNGWDAVDYLRLHAADLIILDVEMPGMNGLELFQVLRRIPGQASVPVVFLSSCDHFKIIDSAMELGATDYISKPIDVVDLLARVRCLSRLTQIRREGEHLSAQYHALESTIGSVLKRKYRP